MMRRASKRATRYWSGRVTRESNAMDLEPGVFKIASPRELARSLMRSAEQSTRKKGPPFQSAMSMLNFYVNRAGRLLSASRKRILNQAKEELRGLRRRR